MKLLYFKDLAAKGIKLTMPTIRKKEADGTFPTRLRLTQRNRPWTDEMIDEHIRALADQSAKETALARQAAEAPAKHSKRGSM
jgi:predicted DNA-binding transcriptional regulator AlpA